MVADSNGGARTPMSNQAPADTAASMAVSPIRFISFFPWGRKCPRRRYVSAFKVYVCCGAAGTLLTSWTKFLKGSSKHWRSRFLLGERPRQLLLRNSPRAYELSSFSPQAIGCDARSLDYRVLLASASLLSPDFALCIPARPSSQQRPHLPPNFTATCELRIAREQSLKLKT